MVEKVPWDAERFAKKVKGTTPKEGRVPESRLEAGFQKNLGDISKPCVIVDTFGRIITWYLPDFLDDGMIVGLLFPDFLRLFNLKHFSMI